MNPGARSHPVPPAQARAYKGEPMSEWSRAVIEMIELSLSGDEDAEAALLAFQTAHRHAFPSLCDKAFR